MLLLVIPVATAGVVTVTPGGSPGTVAEAIALAESGDVIEVPAGRLTGCASLGGRDLTIRGAGAADTTLAGEGCGALLAATAAESLTVEDLTLTNAGGRCIQALGGAVTATGVTVVDCGSSDEDGGGAWLRTVESVFTDCRFDRNAGDEGAAILARNGGTLTLTDTTFSGNTAAEQGGAIYGNGDVDGVVEGCTFTDNAAPGPGGGAIAWHMGTLRIADTAFSRNTGGAHAGALFAHHVSEGVSLDRVTFDDNEAAVGGAVEASFGTVLQVDGGAFRGNVADTAGGAVAQRGGALTLRGTTLSNNTSGGSGGGIDANGDAPVVVTDAAFCRDAAAGDGGAVRIDTGRLTLRNAVFEHAAAGGEGGAVSATRADVEAAWLTLVDSHAPRGAGFALTAGTLDLHSTLLAWSTGGPALSVDPDTRVTGGWNGWWDNASGDAGDAATGPAVEDVTDDPALLRHAGGACETDDLRPSVDSPLVDGGRPDAVDPDGSRSDIGAWGGPDATWTDADGDGIAWPADCDDTDPAVTDCGDTGTPDDSGAAGDSSAPTDPDDTADPGDGVADPGVPTGSSGGCGGGAAFVLLLLSLPWRRRASRPGSAARPPRPTRSEPAARRPGAGRSAPPSP